MRQSRTLSYAGSIASLLLSAALSACGGGGDGAPATQTASVGTSTTTGTASTPTSPPPTAPVAKPTSNVSPACSGCGAVDANTYAGSGVGVWQNTNPTASAASVPVSIDGLSGQDVTLVFTNESAAPQVMPTISLTAMQSPNLLRNILSVDTAKETSQRAISEFNRTGWAELADKRGTPNFSMIGAPNRSVVNDTKVWYHEDGTARTATLQKQVTASDGVTVNFWVENTEFAPAKVSSSIVDTLAQNFSRTGGIYDMLKSMGGPAWGPHSYSNLIAGTGQPIDIVILNFDNNNTPFGWIGYFWSYNNFTRSTSTPKSNESVSLYLDSETLYLGGAAGLKDMLLTMAHEGMHMQNFYRRAVLGGASYAFDTWLEEATAMMMEDFASPSIDPTYNNVRDVRFPDYITYGGGSYNCSLFIWTPFAGSCDSYSVSGSFGGFLNRQLGLGFYKNLLTNLSSTDSKAVLDAAIKSAQPTSSVAEQLRRWAITSNSLMPATSSPAGYGYPARTEGGFTLPLIDPHALAGARTLPTAVPTSLQAFASFPVVRKAVKGTYSETVQVPAGTTLSIVIQ